DSGADLDVQLNAALNITDRQNFVFNSSFVLSSSSCITPDGGKGDCKALSRCANYTDLGSRLDIPANVDFFRERLCRLLHRIVHVCCPSEIVSSESTQSKPLPDSSFETRQRPQNRTQPPSPPQPADPPRRRPDISSQPADPPRRRPDISSQPADPPRRRPDISSQPEEQPEESQPETEPEQPTQPELTPEEPQQPGQSPTESPPSFLPSDEECGLPRGPSRTPGDVIQKYPKNTVLPT
ncbi:hypothetical protein SK128_020380, partial [Halocaridina rubra]